MTDMNGWRRLPAAQQPTWPDKDRLEAVGAELGRLPALVTPSECDRLTGRLAAVARGEALMLLGADRAESFGEARPGLVDGKIRFLLELATALSHRSRVPVVRTARFAGQFAKPRPLGTEERDGVELPAYLGDGVNGQEFSPAARVPDPRRLLRSYRCSAEVLARYRSAGPDVELYSAHEALILDYESALARTDPGTGAVYAGSGHLLWIGERTRALGGAHLEFARHIRNPIGVKVGPEIEPGELLRLAGTLNPGRLPGRLTFVTRMGASRIEEVLPPLIEKIGASGVPVVWLCDPLHGNTRLTSSGHKTREFADVLDEVEKFVRIHDELGTWAGGVQVEFTDGAGRTDPRLTREEALHLPLRWRADQPRRTRSGGTADG
ncbi:3-deoxy-7-phosphoheptulonate synthase [Microbispora amethystogenes]|uniref:3-deoxy-7-phosphoheptulonate synthase n=1 Tax=Microbispora amethystogenes TaxID=1427754 RepID=UPI0033FDE322